MLGINVRDHNQTIAQDFKLDNAVTYPSIYDPPFRIAAATGPLMIGILAAAAAGLISFASPCVVPLVPGYMPYLASVVGGKGDHDVEGARWSPNASGQ